jgi:hypothetical protein
MRLDGLSRLRFPETPSPYPQKNASPSVRGKPLIDKIFFQKRRRFGLILNQVRASVPPRRFLTRAPTRGISETIPSEWAQKQRHGNGVPGDTGYQSP